MYNARVYGRGRFVGGGRDGLFYRTRALHRINRSSPRVPFDLSCGKCKHPRRRRPPRFSADDDDDDDETVNIRYNGRARNNTNTRFRRSVYGITAVYLHIYMYGGRGGRRAGDAACYL